MKLPERSPKLQDISTADLRKIVEFSATEDARLLFQRANEEYLYWDKFKYLNIPEPTSKDIAWVSLRLMRNSQIKQIPMVDKAGYKFRYWLPDTVLKILHYVDQKAGGRIAVEDPRVHSAEQERYLVSSIMEEAIASSLLEGAATTRKKAKEMLRSGQKPSNTAEQMVLNNYITIKNIKNMLNRNLSKDLILELQASITKDTLETPSAVGRFKKEGEENEIIDESDGTVLFEPPPVNEIENRINELCNFANTPNDDIFIHPVIKAIILHFWLSYIHPFVDGNGRTARAIFYWYMLKNEYWLFEYISISRIILKAPGQYKRAFLYSEIDNTDLTYFILFNLRIISLAIRDLHIYLSKKIKELREIGPFIKKHPGLNHRQYDLLHYAVSHPDGIFTIKNHQNIHNVVYETARADLLELIKKGFLTKIKVKGKQFCLVPSKDMHNRLRECGTK